MPGLPGKIASLSFARARIIRYGTTVVKNREERPTPKTLCGCGATHVLIPVVSVQRTHVKHPRWAGSCAAAG